MPYKPEVVIPICPNCQTELVKKTKDGREYYACPNWKPRNMGCKGYFWSSDKEPPKDKPQPARRETPDPMLLVLDETRKINERLDKMADFLLEKLDDK